jgi:hypothetical protein
MMADLSAMGVGDLRQRAASVGVAAQQIEDARDSDDPKGELIALITAAAVVPVSSLGVSVPASASEGQEEKELYVPRSSTSISAN